jgi:hypothetical protein
MRKWYDFLKSLETEGGSIVILFALVIMFSAFVKMEFFKDAESQLYFILGALVSLLKGNNNKELEPLDEQKEKNSDTNTPA